LSTKTVDEVTIAPGDLVTVEAGQIVKWQVHDKIRKHYIFFD